jgi:hypothetical protein
MPFEYSATRNVVTPVPTSVPTTEARIERLSISTPAESGVNQYAIDVNFAGGRIVSGAFVAVERNSKSFDDTETRALLGGGLGAALETSILNALRAAGKLPPGTVT